MYDIVCVCVQVWVHWVEQCRKRKTEREKTTAAERHWAARKKATCWTAWTTYIEYRGKKRHMNGRHFSSIHVNTKSRFIHKQL